MDKTTLVILLIIVAGTISTLGSPNIEDYLEDYIEKSIDTGEDSTRKGQKERKNLKSLLLSSKDEHNKVTKRGFGLEDLKSLTDLLGSILSKLGSIKRTIIINIENKTGYRWLASNVHFDSGSSNAPMPYSINSGETVKYEGQLGGGGVVGVMTYYIPKINETLAVMFYVPFVYHYNWWNVKLYKGNQEATESIYKEMIGKRNNRLKGDNAWYHRYLNSNDTIEMRGAMASSGNTALQITVYKNQAENE